MPAQNFYLALLNTHTQMISFAYHVDAHTPKPAPQPLNAGLTSVVLRTGQALLVRRDRAARKPSTGLEITLEGFEGASYLECGVPAAIWLGVPLGNRGHTLGVLAV